jgi:predicted porin
MKKSLIALAVLATAGVASAQSSVTLFGIVDATLAFGKGSGVGSSSKTQLTNSGYNGSRLGFRGTEDLGGGMSASFWLEAGVTNDDGAWRCYQHQQPSHRRRRCWHRWRSRPDLQPSFDGEPGRRLG